MRGVPLERLHAKQRRPARAVSLVVVLAHAGLLLVNSLVGGPELGSGCAAGPHAPHHTRALVLSCSTSTQQRAKSEAENRKVERNDTTFVKQLRDFAPLNETHAYAQTGPVLYACCAAK